MSTAYPSGLNIPQVRPPFKIGLLMDRLEDLWTTYSCFSRTSAVPHDEAGRT